MMAMSGSENFEFLYYIIVRICFELTHIKENAKEKNGMRSKRLSRIINREGN